jgi:hypothetical protein
MTNQEAWSAYQRYLDAWNTTSLDERTAIAAEVLSDDVEYQTGTTFPPVARSSSKTWRRSTNASQAGTSRSGTSRPTMMSRCLHGLSSRRTAQTSPGEGIGSQDHDLRSLGEDAGLSRRTRRASGGRDACRAARSDRRPGVSHRDHPRRISTARPYRRGSRSGMRRSAVPGILSKRGYRKPPR